MVEDKPGENEKAVKRWMCTLCIGALIMVCAMFFYVLVVNNGGVESPTPSDDVDIGRMYIVNMIDSATEKPLVLDGDFYMHPVEDPSWSNEYSFAEFPIENGVGIGYLPYISIGDSPRNFVSHVDGYYDVSWIDTVYGSSSVAVYAHKIGAFEELLITNATDGSVNGQTDITNPYNEIQIIDENTICYNKSNGDGLFYLILNIGAFGNNEYLKNPVIYTHDTVELYTPEWCVWTIQAARDRGSSDVYLPKEIYRDAVYDISPESEYLMSGIHAQYIVVFAVCEESCGHWGSFEIVIDDLDGDVDIQGSIGADAKRLAIVFRE